MNGLLQHLRYTIRVLLKSPGFTITTVLVLGLGIGANTAIFSLVNGVLFKPLPYPKAERLVQIFQPFRSFDKNPLDYPDYRDFNANQRTFEGLTVFFNDDFNLSGQGDPERISGLYVSGSFFKVLGRPLVLGRPFGETEDKPDAPAVVVLSERLWRTRFQSDPKIIGANVSLNSRSFEVIGVTLGQADESRKVDLYVPLSQSPDFASIKIRRGAHNFSAIGRLKEGITLQQAQADLEVIDRSLLASYPVWHAGFGARLMPYLDSVVNDYSATLWLLEAAVAFLFLITCANVANLLVARAQERRREIVIRAALGADWTKLVVHLLVESAVLALAGGVFGLLLSVFALNAIKVFAPPNITRFQEIGLNGGSLVLVVVVILFTALFSGLFPAWSKSKANLAFVLKEEGDRAGTAGPQRQRSQNILVAAQVALTCLLLIGAGLLARSFQVLQSTPLGFKPGHVLVADIYLADTKYADQAACKSFFNALLNTVRHLPGIAAVGLNDNLPFTGPEVHAFGIAGEPDPEPGKMPILEHQVVSPDYFGAVGIPLLRGRMFDEQDQANKQKVVIINEALAQHFFPGQDAVGKQIHDVNSIGEKQRFYTICGIVSNVQHDSPESQRTPYQAYYLYAQDP